MPELEIGGELRETLHKRHDLLTALAAQPQTKPELVKNVGASRSTIDRAVSELESVNCIHRIKSRYDLTPLGKAILKEHQNYMKITADLANAGALLDDIPYGSPMSNSFLRGVDAYVASPQVPESALQPSIDYLRCSERMLGLAPVALSLYIEILENVINENNIQSEIIIHQNTLNSLPDFYRGKLKNIYKSNNIVFYRTEDDLPYALWIMEQEDNSTAGITVHKNGGVQGVLMNDSDEAIGWAQREYEQYRAKAERIPFDVSQ